jgi:hypothetical protein
MLLLLLLLITAWMIIAVAAPTAASAIIAVVDYVILLTALSVLPAGENVHRMNNPGRRRFIGLIAGFPAAAAAYSSQLVVKSVPLL